MVERRKNFRKVIISLVIIILAVLASLFFVLFFKKYNHFEENNNDSALNHYGINVVTNKDSNIYINENDEYVKAGVISEGELVTLKDESINENTKYFTIDKMDRAYYIAYSDVDKIDKAPEENDNRYKKYIVFNENVKSSNMKIYDDDKLVYEFNIEMFFPIIIKEDDRYYIEYANRLLSVKKDEVEVVESHNTDEMNTSGIGVLNYHFFYDETNADEARECQQVICASKSQFKEHLDYIKNNNFLTLKMKELEMYIDGKIRLPKSVVITIDDGWLTEIAENMLKEYQMYGTIFVVTSWNDPKKYISDYVEVHSHSDNMHNQGDCPSGQGGGIQCLPEETILNDLKTSSEKIGGTNVFCYPFYEYNEYSIKLLKQAGYTMAFAGKSAGSDNLVKVGSDKFRLPRFVVVNFTTMNDFSRYLNGTYRG